MKNPKLENKPRFVCSSVLKFLPHKGNKLIYLKEVEGTYYAILQIFR